MSEHAWVQENLDAYVTAALSAQECSRVERHLATCAECTHARAEISDIEQLMQGICTRVRPDVGLEDRAIQRLRLARGPRPRWLRFVAAAAAVILLGAVGGTVQMLAFDGTLPLPGMGADVAQGRVCGEGFALGVDIVGGTILAKGKRSNFTEEKARLEMEEDHFKAGKADPEAPETKQQGAVRSLRGWKANDIAETEKSGKNSVLVLDGKPGEITVNGKRDESPRLPNDDESDLNKRLPPPPAQPRFFGEDKESRTKEKKLANERSFFDMDDKHKELKVLEDGLKKFDDKAVHLNADVTKAMKDLAMTAPGMAASRPAGIASGGGSGGGGGRGVGGPGGLGMPGLMPSGPGGPGASSSTTASTGSTKDTQLGYYFNQSAPVVNTSSGAYLPMVPPPVTQSQPSAAEKPSDQKPPEKSVPPTAPVSQQNPGVEAEPPAPEKTGRMIIRTGEMEFETDSFDNAVETITKLITGTKGGFIATVNSDKLANGKTRGSVIVRMSPTLLDKFIYDLRRELAKTSELKNQRLGSLDVTKQYTDIESRLRAARALEERLIAIIKTGKGEIKDLVAAEKELGVWRTKIEEMEGEIRYYANQVSLSTLTITLAEKEIQAPTAIVVTETVTLRIEVDEVAKAHQTAMKMIEELKGRITRSELQAAHGRAVPVGPARRHSADEERGVHRTAQEARALLRLPGEPAAAYRGGHRAAAGAQAQAEQRPLRNHHAQHCQHSASPQRRSQGGEHRCAGSVCEAARQDREGQGAGARR